jgi:hypothetical protein
MTMRRTTGDYRRPQTIADILARFMKKRHIPFYFERNALRLLWDKAVGDQIASQTEPVHLKKGVLHVKVATSIWMHQLQFMKDDIRERFNALSGKPPILGIKFVLGELTGGGTGTEKNTAPTAWEPLSDWDRRTIEESLAIVTDPELRAVLERVMVQEISRRRHLQKRQGR